MGAIFWAISTAIFAILEIIIPGLITIWLALASLILTVLTLFFTNFAIEFLIFAILSLIFVLFTRPVLQKYMQKHSTKFNVKSVGEKIKIIKVIDIGNEQKQYEVKFKAAIWTGISKEIFSENEIVKIKSFEGNKIILEKIKERGN